MTETGFYLGTIDRHVARLSDEEIWQLCLDGDLYDREGKIGDCLLRQVTMAWIEENDAGSHIIAIMLTQVAHAAHKHRSMRLAVLENRHTGPEL